MTNITIRFKDGTTRTFLHEGRAGGSYTKRLELRDGWVIVEDEYGRQTAFPSVDIAEVKKEPGRW